MAKTFNSLEDNDYRTVDVSGKVVIMTHDSTRIHLSDYSYENTGIIRYGMIDLDRDHEFEPGDFYMKAEKRQLSTAQLQKKYKCVCGSYTLNPISDGLRHQSIIECQCEQCRARIFIEIPYKRER
ncbi:MAG: hypothetical protein ACP5NW_05865 [Candidatus Woesearchaeota archaeon]